MTLKTATTLAIVGISINLLALVGRTLKVVAAAPPPPLDAWIGWLSAITLQCCLLLFFVTLYRKQQSTSQ
jgi:hypothetical protein